MLRSHVEGIGTQAHLLCKELWKQVAWFLDISVLFHNSLWKLLSIPAHEVNIIQFSNMQMKKNHWDTQQ